LQTTQLKNDTTWVTLASRSLASDSGACGVGGGGSAAGGNSAVDGAIAGFRWPDQVGPIPIAANLELSDEDAAELEGSTR
jgi:hypothetical protein